MPLRCLPKLASLLHDAEVKVVNVQEALSVVESGHRVFVHEAAMVPRLLLDGLVARAHDLRDVEVVHLHIEGDAPHVAPALEGHLRHNALFVGSNTRAAVREGRADFTPVFLSEVPRLFSHGRLPLDIALVQVSPPDRHGYCRLGVSVAAARAAVDHAKIVIAQINPRVPVTDGHTAIHVSNIHAAVECDEPLPSRHAPSPSPTASAIAKLLAAEIPDGATLQLGIGEIPDAVLSALHQHADLGLHTEMFSDGVLGLVASGALTGARKSRFQHRIVSSFAVGSEALYSFCDRNPGVEFHPSDIVNDTREIARQHAMVAINSALSIDLTGQVCADSLGPAIYSGIGGQMDFVRGATRSRGGKAFIAMTSTACKGTVSRICAQLSPGAGVVTTRGHVQYVATEYGIADLQGKTLRQRAEALIAIAHPEFQPELRAAAVERRWMAL